MATSYISFIFGWVFLLRSSRDNIEEKRIVIPWFSVNWLKADDLKVSLLWGDHRVKTRKFDKSRKKNDQTNFWFVVLVYS